MANFGDKDFDFCIKYGLNVILRGEAGCGKTTMVLDAFRRNDLKFKYFSAATMDPFLDFVGLPKEKTVEFKDEETGVIKSKTYIDLILPREFADDQVEAIFLDEFNRAHKKVRNAVMELIQFKSINGREFKNLKIVWAAINPDDTTLENSKYDVEPLDPAQLDRFQVHVDVKYAPKFEYFQKRYGKQIAEVAIEWWNALPPETKKVVSPRRLDYALDISAKGGNLYFVLPKDSNITKLVNSIKTGPVLEKLQKFMETEDTEGAQKFLNDDNNYISSESYIVKEDMAAFFIPLVNTERFTCLVEAEKTVKRAVEKDPGKFSEHLDTVVKSKIKLSPWAAEQMRRAEQNNAAVDFKNYSNLKADPGTFVTRLHKIESELRDRAVAYNKEDYVKKYNSLAEVIPRIESLSAADRKMTVDVFLLFLKGPNTATVATQFPLVAPLLLHTRNIWSTLPSAIVSDIEVKLDQVRKAKEK